MKKFIILVAFCLAMCSFAFAQSSFPELDKIKQIKLLKSTREDVKRIFKEYAKDAETNAIEDVDTEEEVGFDHIPTENMTIHIFYSHGDCSGEDSAEEWNVPKGKVTEVFVLFDDSVKPKDLKLDVSKLEQLKIDEDDDDEDNNSLYYDKETGISYSVSDGKIEHIKFIPPEKDYPALCNNENVRQFNSHKEWFRSKIRDSWVSYHPRPFANLDELTLSKNEITAYCITKKSPKGEICSEDAKIEIAAKGASTDPTDVLTYVYKVTGGKIVCSGANVTWNLTGVKPGKYTITAGVDNGCGVCGTTKTETVEVKNCPDCSVKPK